MRILKQADGETLSRLLRASLRPRMRIDMAVAGLSVFALEIVEQFTGTERVRLLLPEEGNLDLLGDAADRVHRSRLQHRGLVAATAEWLRKTAEVRRVPKGVPQGLVVIRDAEDRPVLAVVGSFTLSTSGLGAAAGNPMNFVQAFEGDEAASPAEWFDQQWSAYPPNPAAATALADEATSLVAPRPPRDVYALLLHHLLGSQDGALDEERIVDAATGIKNTSVWQMLYRFQRDGVVRDGEANNRPRLRLIETLLR